MKVIIIEDEKPARDKLMHFLKRYDKGIEVIGMAESIAETVDLLSAKGSLADVLLMDIQLSDGPSFAALDQLSLQKPVIFITAHNQHALEAFRANGIDYLLKPLTFEAFSNSLDKLKNFGLQSPSLQEIGKQLSSPAFKQRFLVKIGEHIHSVPTESILLFYAEGRNSYLLTKEGRRMITDYKLEALESMLDPKQFFRLNRSYIISLSGIKDVLIYSSSRLKINPAFDFKEELIVSRDKVNAFKSWYAGEGVKD